MSLPGCIPCKVHAEDTPILTIDSIVICQTHAGDLRRRLLKMHPGMSTLEEFNEAVEAGLYNKCTRYGKMTVHFYHNEQFILKIYNYKTFFKQGSDETIF